MDETELEPVVKVVKSILSAASSLQFFYCYEASERRANGLPPYQPRAKLQVCRIETLKSFTLNTLDINPT